MRRCRPQNLSPSPHVTLFVYAFLWTRQNALAYNQPLSFNTSSVRNMDYMFNVRLSACPCANSPIGLSSPLHASPSTHALLPGPQVALSACLLLDSAERASVQPDAEFQHVQRHKHRPHVSGALRACPCPSCTSRVFPARCLGCRSHALPPRPACRPLSMPPFGLGSRRRRSTSR